MCISSTSDSPLTPTLLSPPTCALQIGYVHQSRYSAIIFLMPSLITSSAIWEWPITILTSPSSQQVLLYLPPVQVWLRIACSTHQHVQSKPPPFFESTLSILSKSVFVFIQCSPLLNYSKYSLKSEQSLISLCIFAQKNGVITIEKNMITDIESATFEI